MAKAVKRREFARRETASYLSPLDGLAGDRYDQVKVLSAVAAMSKSGIDGAQFWPLSASNIAHMSDAILILTCGLPGAGKTTLAMQLAAERSAVRLTKDEWLWAIGSSPWHRPTGEKLEQELWHFAQEILSLGLSVVLDFGLWARVERDEMRTVARHLGVGVELHYLEVPSDELWRRIEVRNSAPPWDNEPISRANLDEWLGMFQAPDAAELALFDPPPRGN